MKLPKLNKKIKYAVPVLAIGAVAGFFVLTNQPTNTVQNQSTPETMTVSQVSPTETTTPATTEPAVPTPTPSPSTTPPAPAPTTASTPIHDLTRQYAISQGETEHQAGCFYNTISYRTNWNISEEEMHSKFTSMKATYGSLCSAYQVAAQHPAGEALKGM